VIASSKEGSINPAFSGIRSPFSFPQMDGDGPA
jgi:hypothetical protein